MIFEKDKFWFATCDGDCKKDYPFYSGAKLSMIWNLQDDDWEVHDEDKCYCPKCLRKMK